MLTVRILRYVDAQIQEEILAVLDHVKEAETRHGGVSDLRHMCAQTVFSLFDHLTKFTRHRARTLSLLMQQANKSKTASERTEFFFFFFFVLENEVKTSGSTGSWDDSGHTILSESVFLFWRILNFEVMSTLAFQNTVWTETKATWW